MMRRPGDSPLARIAPTIFETRPSSRNWRADRLTATYGRAPWSFALRYELAALTVSRITKAPSSKGVALFEQKNGDAGGHASAFGMEPTHQGLETHHFIRRQVHDGLEVHDQFSGVH